MIRNYYSYLWGMPMKLRDPGTRLDPEIRETTFEGRPVRALKFTYGAEVGSDTLHFYWHASPRRWSATVSSTTRRRGTANTSSSTGSWRTAGCDFRANGRGIRTRSANIWGPIR